MSQRRARLRSSMRGAAILGGWLLCAAIAGCGPAGEERQAARQSPVREADWVWLQRAKRTLDDQRVRLGGEAAADPQLARQSAALATEFNRRLAEFINADPPVQGEPLSERQRAAIRMKSDEDIRLARQFIAQAGDYQRAIDIFKEALLVDPGNPQLQQELARAKARRYMARETFAQVKVGMSQEEVRGLLGQPNLHNVREYPDRHVVGWFYPKDESGAAAAVWFHDEEGRPVVYLLDFDALRPRSPAAAPPAVPRSST